MDTNPPTQSAGISRLPDDHRTCPCGALAEPPRRGPCRKCQARALWRRRHQRPARLARRAVTRARRHIALLAVLALAIRSLATVTLAQASATVVRAGMNRPGGEH